MKLQKKPVLFVLLFSGTILFIFLLLQPLEIRYGGDLVAMLFPKGMVARKERNLLLIIQGLMLLVVIPVYFLTYLFSWKYRAYHSKEKYDPDLYDNVIAEYIWWGVPCILVIIIGILTWRETYRLDPFRPLVSDTKPITIQVVALQWKWLFIYPEEKIASVNFVQFPEKTPLNFEITADAPMNSFWIPHLGSQIYAMPKMKTKVHLMADTVGDMRGCSANISGVGFSHMNFIARSSKKEDFQNWTAETKKSTNILTFEEYNKLAKPTIGYPVTLYNLKDVGLFDQIIQKFMHPSKKE